MIMTLRLLMRCHEGINRSKGSRKTIFDWLRYSTGRCDKDGGGVNSEVGVEEDGVNA